MPALKTNLTLGACLAIMAIGGCGKPLNFEPNADALFIPPSPSPTPSAAAKSDQGADDDEFVGPEETRTVLTLDRGGWSRTTIIVPNMHPMHQVHYTWNLHDDTSIPRNAGRYPTAASACDLPTYQSEADQIREAIFGPFVAMGDIVLFIPRAIVARPVMVSRAGLKPYERLPRPVSTIRPEPVIPLEPPTSELP